MVDTRRLAEVICFARPVMRSLGLGDLVNYSTSLALELETLQVTGMSSYTSHESELCVDANTVVPMAGEGLCHKGGALAAA